MMELLGKMSEAYMTAKKENNDLRARVTAAESENAELKKKMAKLHKKIDKLKASQVTHIMPRSNAEGNYFLNFDQYSISVQGTPWSVQSFGQKLILTQLNLK